MPFANTQVLNFLKSPWPANVASAIILMLIAWWAIANVVPLFMAEEDSPAVKQDIQQVQPKPQASLGNLYLFGKAENKAASNRVSEAQQTTLNFTLRGILATDDPKQGFAQIQNAKKQERNFAVNDSVFGKATLEEIYVDRVILLHNGRYETLLLPEKFLNVKHFSVEQQKLEQKKIATDFRDLFLRRDMETLRKLFGFDTAWKNGSFVGFIIKALSERGHEMLATFGIKNGDLITVVNGLRFSESLEAAEQLKGLKTATSVDIIIERDGQELPFHIEFDTPIAETIASDDNSGSTRPANSTSNSSGAGDPPSGDGHATAFSSSTASSNTSDADDQNSDTGRSSFGGSSISTGRGNIQATDDDEELGVDWDETEEAREFQRKQEERTTGGTTTIEYDH